MRIHAIQTGIVHVKSDFLRGSVAAGGTLRFLGKLFTDKTTVDLPIYAWLIEHPEGLIVVDTGDRADTEKNFITQSTFTILPEEEIGAQITRLGYSIKDIKQVILTHLHSDHIDGLPVFEGIPVFTGEKEYATYKTYFGGMLTRRTSRLPEWFDPKPIVFKDAPFGSFPRSVSLTRAGDVIAVPTPGHTLGHMSIIALQGDHSVFMAGDVTYNQQALLDQTLQGPTMDVSAHPHTLSQVLAYTQSTPTIYLPAHDWDSGKRLAEKRTVPASAKAAPVIA